MIKIKFPNKANLVVYDYQSVEFLGGAVLHGLDYQVLITPNSYFCSIKVFLFFLNGLFKISWKYIKSENFSYQSFRSQFYIAYLYAVIKSIAPKIIVTFSDNDWRFHFLSRICVGPKFISIQNGARTDWSFVKDFPVSTIHPGHKIIGQMMFTFGEVERELYEKYQHRIDEFIPVGSLRSSIFFEKIVKSKEVTCKKKYDLLLISQWGEGHMVGISFPEIRRSINQTCLFLKEWLQGKDINFAIALRSSDPRETFFYEEKFRGCNYVLIGRDKGAMSSYFAAFHSDVIVTLDSTLGREAYGWGKKVFFVNLTEDPLYKTPVLDDLYFTGKSNLDFSISINKIFSENYNEYLNRTKSNREWLIKFSTASPFSHEIVRDGILRILGQT